MNIIREDIKCDKTLKLIHSGLKAGFIEKKVLSNNLTMGTPQGSVLSPLLCNVYFHKLDVFMAELQERYKKGFKRPANKLYTSLQNRVKYMRRKGLHITKMDEYKGTLSKLINTPSLAYNDSYIRVHYLRYADNFVIGVEGSYQITLQIMEELKTFLLTLKLVLNEKKTKITKFNEKPIEFLGYKIMSPYIDGMEKPLEKYKEPVSGRIVTRRKKTRVRIFIDHDKVIKRLESRKLIRKRIAPTSNDKIEYRGTFQGNIIQLDHPDILRYFNSVMRGIFNYYCFVNNMKQLAHIMWLLEESCCMTLMKKYRLKTMRQAYHKFGKDLGYDITDKKGNIRRIKLAVPASYKRINIKDVVAAESTYPNIEAVWNNKLTKTGLFRTCVVCGTDKNIEMHHVRKIRDLKHPEMLEKDFLTRQMMAINRKQIPLCQEHHGKYHNGKLTELEKRNLKQTLRPKATLVVTLMEDSNSTKNVNTVKQVSHITSTSDTRAQFRDYLDSVYNVDHFIEVKPSSTEVFKPK
jgi:hypothetical protein